MTPKSSSLINISALTLTLIETELSATVKARLQARY